MMPTSADAAGNGRPLERRKPTSTLLWRHSGELSPTDMTFVFIVFG